MCWPCGEISHIRRECPLNSSPNGGRLAKKVIDFHRPYQISTTISSVNAVFCVNGCIGETSTKFLLDPGAAVSVVNYNVIKTSITKAATCAVGANGTPLDVIGQSIITVKVADFKVDYQFMVVRNLTVNCLIFTQPWSYSRLL